MTTGNWRSGILNPPPPPPNKLDLKMPYIIGLNNLLRGICTFIRKIGNWNHVRRLPGLSSQLVYITSCFITDTVP